MNVVDDGLHLWSQRAAGAGIAEIAGISDRPDASEGAMPKGGRIDGNEAVGSVGVESGVGDELGRSVGREEVDEIRGQLFWSGWAVNHEFVPAGNGCDRGFGPQRHAVAVKVSSYLAGHGGHRVQRVCVMHQRYLDLVEDLTATPAVAGEEQRFQCGLAA